MFRIFCVGDDAMEIPALHKAAKDGDMVTLQQLLLQPNVVCDIDVECEWKGSNRTPLIFAAENGHIEVVIALARAGANLDVAIYESGICALQVAAEMGHLEVLVALLHGGADVDAVDDRGMCAMHYAKNAAVMEMLLAAGGNSDVVMETRGTYGTPLGVLCARTERPDVHPLKRRNWATAEVELAIAKIQVLLRYGSDTSIEGGNPGESGAWGPALTCAVYNGVEGMVRTLLDAGADPNGATGVNVENLPLCQALRFPSYVEIVRLLLRAGADPNRRRHPVGLTPLHVACQETAPLEVVLELLRWKADPEAQVGWRVNGAGTPAHFVGLGQNAVDFDPGELPSVDWSTNEEEPPTSEGDLIYLLPIPMLFVLQVRQYNERTAQYRLVHQRYREFCNHV